MTAKINDSQASLEHLNDIVVAPMFALFPLPPGAVLLLFTLALWLVSQGFKYIRRYKANAYRRQALKQLYQAQTQADVAPLPELLKRVALTAYGSSEVASLSGHEWLSFLNRSSQIPEFMQPVAWSLCQLPYQPELQASLSASEKDTLFTICKQWIVQHKGGVV